MFETVVKCGVTITNCCLCCVKCGIVITEVFCVLCSMSISQLMNVTSAAAAADMEDHEAQTSYADTLLTTMKQVHDTIGHLEVSSVVVSNGSLT